MLKSTGIVRKVDELGRVVIPIELRRTLGIDVKDSLEIYVDSERIILKKYEPACLSAVMPIMCSIIKVASFVMTASRNWLLSKKTSTCYNLTEMSKAQTEKSVLRLQQPTRFSFFL